jgi:hypothetical protein
MDFKVTNRKEIGDKIVFSLESNRAVALTGGIGVGKIFLARAAMQHIGCRVLEFNGGSEIQEVRIPRQRTGLDGSLHGMIVKGMENAVADTYKAIKKHAFIDKSSGTENPGTRYETRYPVIFSVPSKSKFKFGEKYCDYYDVPALSKEDIVEILSGINKKAYTPDILYTIAEACNGDIRKAINAMEIGRIEPTGKYEKLGDMVKAFLACDPEDRISILTDNLVGEYGGVPMGYFISLLARNIKGTPQEIRSDMKILDAVSRAKYMLPLDAVRYMVCGLNQNRIKFLKWPKKKVEKNEPGHDNAKINLVIEED